MTERENVTMMLEGTNTEKNKICWSIPRAHAMKSPLFAQILQNQHPHKKTIRDIRVKVDCSSAVLYVLKSYFDLGDQDITDWANGIQEELLVDVLVLATHLRMHDLCTAICARVLLDADGSLPIDVDDSLSPPEQEAVARALQDDQPSTGCLL